MGAKMPLAMKLYMATYPIQIWWKKTFGAGEKMNSGIDLTGKKAIIFGVANDQSIAYHIAKKLNDAGCRCAFAYQDRVEQLVKPLLGMFDKPFAQAADVVNDESLDAFFAAVEKEFGKVDFLVHSIAFAKKDHLAGKFMSVDRRGYQVSQEVSAYSLTELTRRALPMMNADGSIIAMTYFGAEKVMPNYNVMGVAKAALEASVRYLASDVGENGIRVNAISAGPVKTLAASGISGFDKMLDHVQEKAPLRRNIDADDVGNLGLFLCSDMSKNITGQVLYVDAGYSIMGF